MCIRDSAKVDHGLATGAPVDEYSGFAIGRSIWSKEVGAWNDGDLEEAEAASRISANFRRFIDVYEAASD